MSIRLLFTCLLTLAAAQISRAEPLEPALQSKIDTRLQQIAAWAADPVIVEAVRTHNTAVPPEHAALSQDKWRALTVLDPLVRSFTKNAAAQFLKTKKDDIVTEIFLSDAHGLKVAFLAKTTNWSHHGKEKHEVPMTGKSWQGPVEVDESSGQQQLQVAVPVIDGGHAIGSLVVGLSITKLKQ